MNENELKLDNHAVGKNQVDRVCTISDSSLNQAGIEIPITTYDLIAKTQDEGER